MSSTTATPATRILIVDDDEDDFFITSDYIKSIPGHSFATDWCSNYDEALTQLISSTHDIYFVDYRLNIKTGIDLLRAAQHKCESPIILLTGKGNQKIDMEAMHLGAADYLVKSDLNSEKLDRCIRYALNQSSILKELKRSERKYRNIFEKTNDVIFIADNNFNLITVNPAATLLLGYSSDELLNKSLLDFFASDNGKADFTQRVSETQKIEDFRTELVTKTQERKNCVISARMESNSQDASYIQGIIHDITLIKKAEEIVLQSEKLEAKGRVIRTLAHEVRNPLNNITLSIENMKGEATESILEYIDIIQRNSKRIDDLINDLMDSSRYYKMNLVVMTLQQAMELALDGAIDRINLSKIKLTRRYSPDPALAMLDKDKVKIAFLNMIINAIEAMSEKGNELVITINNHPDFHEVHITDNGCGMSSEHVAQVFESYFTSKPNGMGLGLATSQAIIQSHKATVKVTSVLGEGTTFSVLFPAL